MSEAPGAIRLQATIGGMSANATGAGVTLYAMLDAPTGVLMIDLFKVVAPGEIEVRSGDSAVVTNNTACDDYDSIFEEDELRDAITDYFSFAGRGLLALESAVEKFNPSSKIEPDGIDERGRKYRIAPDISNGQIAVIVMCWFAVRQSGFARQLEAFDDFLDTDVETVGIPDSIGRRIVGHTMGGKLAIGSDGWPV